MLPSFQSWLSHEVEVLVSVSQARQTLENLIDDRKLLSRQLAELRNHAQDEDDEPAAKVLGISCLCVFFYCFYVVCFSLRLVCLHAILFLKSPLLPLRAWKKGASEIYNLHLTVTMT